ncbi:MAG TPA: ATP-binding cassette domain-containing protein [Flavisolibacter sp.]|jgi:molybdate transport system ATP-binding protein|nr:ATP-binding cassette domain-containing protein [Flavisolibacter sp.]
MKQISIHINNLKIKQQANVVLDGVSFDLSPGQHLAITGASGSGKTTLAKSIAGHLFHEGSIIIKDEHSNETPFVLFVEHRNEFKNLSNQSNFYYQQRYNSTESEDALTVSQELNSFFEKIFPEQEHSDKISFWLDRIGLVYRIDTPLIQLSNGEHKRLQLIKALMLQPDVLIMDQPFTGLDVQSREIVSKVFDEVSANTVFIMIPGHDEFPSCITHVVELENGTIKQFCSKDQYKKAENQKQSFIIPDTLSTLENSLEFSSAVYMNSVSIRYDEKIIFENVNWNVQKGDKWQVKGANGSGKSTLLSLINGDNPQAYANEIYLFDKRRGSGESIWDIKQKIGYVSPELHWHFDKSISVFETIGSGFFDTMGLYRRLSEEQETLIAKWLYVFHLSEQAFKLLSNLSLSQQRLVMLIRALIKNPALLILDEPCQGLDDRQTADFIYLIDHFCQDKTLIYVSHYDHEVPSSVNKRLELKEGKATITIFEKNEKAVA